MAGLTIVKRSGEEVSFNPNKILARIRKAAKGLKVNPDEICLKVLTTVPFEGKLETRVLDRQIANIAASYTASHYDYSRLAAMISVSSYHKETMSSFTDTMKVLHEQGVVHKDIIDIIDQYGASKVDDIIDHDKDYNFDFFAWRTLQEMYLLKDENGNSIERPQHMYLRVALWVTNSLKEAKEYYQSLSEQRISPATPIMINAGTKVPQLASCVLEYNTEDSGDGLLNTFSDVARYSSSGAGIGLCMTNIRSKKTRIRSSGGYAMGLLKYLKIVNEGLRGFNQQGRRPGAAAIYIEPWHKDVFDLLDIKRNTGLEEARARDLFTALWMPDLFLKAVENDEDWYLFCPHDIKKAGLRPFQELYGEEFEKEYHKAVELGLGEKVKAQEIWKKVYESQIETGVPYLCSKDNANRKTNHQNIGTIRQSNLCNEIYQYTDEKSTAICTLSSMVLKNFIVDGKFDFKLLHQETRRVVRGLNKVIDINSYTTKKGEKGGLEQRAIGIGVQGLADVFFMLDYVFTSDEAKDLNKKIFETIYHAAVTESCKLCEEGVQKPYKYFKGSPMSKGIFQFDMWKETVQVKNEETGEMMDKVVEVELSGMWDWDSLKEKVAKFGICNSLFTAQMPVASSAKVTGSFEMTEPAHSALFSRRVVGGEILLVNKYLVDDFEKLGIWSDQLKNEIVMNDGSIQGINFHNYLDPDKKSYEDMVKRIEHLMLKYQTTWEISQKEIINMAAQRGPFIDQSQSMNLYMSNPTFSKLSSAIIYGWKKGLKTLCYYVRTKAISTGAKHLATDISKFANKEGSEHKVAASPSPYMREPEITLPVMETLPERPKDSEIECIGCGS